MSQSEETRTPPGRPDREDGARAGKSNPAGRPRRSRLWVPLVVTFTLIAAEAAWQVDRHLRLTPLIRVALAAPPAQSRFGATGVNIDFGPFSLPTTLKVTLERLDGGHREREADITDRFIARQNGAVGNLSGLIEGDYILRARVFGLSRGRKDLLVEEDARVRLRAPSPPPLDLA